MTDRRFIVIPDGLAGVRADAGLSKLLGLSRSVCADILQGGGAMIDGRQLDKSDRLVAGAALEVEIPDARDPLEIVPVDIPDLKIV
ncbi:MAG: RNA pseudouridine synthase, partial [Microbacteriaceae bacterium]